MQPRFRAQELMRQEAEFQGADFMQMAAKQKRDDHALGLHLYKAERENLERLFGLWYEALTDFQGTG